MIKSVVRRFVPKPLISAYHFVFAHISTFIYRHPSKQLTVIGVTGTNGKSTTVQFIGRILEHLGERVGWTTTVGFKIAEREWVNDKKMTMLGRFQTQKMLRQMVKAGCRYAVIETSSQGIAQYRHVGIRYDVAVFTNLTPEHLESHGGFEAYKQAKGKLFENVERAKVVNLMDEHAEYFLSFQSGESWGFGYEEEGLKGQKGLIGEKKPVRTIWAEHVLFEKTGTKFEIHGLKFYFKPIGRFYFENVLAAITTCRVLGLSLEQIQDAVERLEPIPGRLEVIDEGQPFSVIVDYAPEPASLSASYEALKLIGYNRFIHVLGSTGGGRDVARRAILGQMSATNADIMIVTNEDPYDDDPMEIINNIADAAVKVGKQENINLFRILDREEAINKAIAVAQPGDLVLLTGKGNEPVMAVAGGKKIPWDDRVAARKALHSL
ncbi:UDP-N-acetylmuramoyl-L-alanyl-D-glutamate--2,6-diaminopimelate ligase [Candidatus Uhrbacteria bacterium]|nr:UDP-N-acetylmuramoyl-L-alanyl-D-glutamate--2,6-diaminopimelate ligase [Candidatus Uhrbacteria bacterium]